jgi:hypothetical protein
MILPDVNLLVYAYSEDAPHHAAARDWWEDALSNGVGVGIPWAVAMGFVRLTTHPRVVTPPMRHRESIAHVKAWLARPRVRVLEPGPRHPDILEHILDAAGVAAALTTDAHLAALAIENQCEIHSNDADFARFPGLRWRNPLASAS